MIIILYGIWNKRRQDKPLQRLGQVWATSGPRATYGSPSTLMWPASFIWSFLNSYIDYENTLNTKKVSVLLQKQPYNQFTRTCIGPQIPNLSLMWPAKPKEFPTPGLRWLLIGLVQTIIMFTKIWICCDALVTQVRGIDTQGPVIMIPDPVCPADVSPPLLVKSCFCLFCCFDPP